MPLADVLALLGDRALTPQQIADFMFSEDRERRRALKAGDTDRAAHHEAELDKLTELFHRS